LRVVVFSIRQTAITVSKKSATRKREIGGGVTRGSPLGVMPALVVPSVLLVLIGTCPYFLSVNREIVVWSKREPYKAAREL
jgi:hypothetical protein